MNIELGSKSNILIPIIIAIENDKEKVINLFIFWLLILTNKNTQPKQVENDANKDTNKALIIFIINYIFFVNNY